MYVCVCVYLYEKIDERFRIFEEPERPVLSFWPSRRVPQPLREPLSCPRGLSCGLSLPFRGSKSAPSASQTAPSASHQCPRPLILLTLTTLQQLFLILPFSLSKCSWTVFFCSFFAHSALPWAPLGLHLGPLGTLLGLTCGLLASILSLFSASWAQLGSSWTPFGSNMGELGPLKLNLGGHWSLLPAFPTDRLAPSDALVLQIAPVLLIAPALSSVPPCPFDCSCPFECTRAPSGKSKTSKTSYNAI